MEEELDDVQDMEEDLAQSHLASEPKEDTAPEDPVPSIPGRWKALEDLDSLPLIKSGYSLEADMKFGWKPRIKGKVLPIPLIFD